MSMVGSRMTMPILITNMGGEMVYILEQRLNAQKIPETKGKKVMNDVIRTMYYPKFIEELFKPQKMYSIQSTRQIFDRLAHSSIMRLNSQSMDKLFDLMAMGFKFQVVSCTYPSGIIDVTMNHLDSLKSLVEDNGTLMELVDECVRQVEASYLSLSLAACNQMRQSICLFFQDRKVKVSFLLHDQTQNADGSLVVQTGGVLPLGAATPGTVVYYSGGAETRRDMLNTAASSLWVPSDGHRPALGCNMYEKDRCVVPLQQATAPAPETAPAMAQSMGTAADPVAAAAAVAEVNTLATLIGVQPPSNETPIKFEAFFGDNVSSVDPTGHCEIEIDAAAPSEHRAHMESLQEEFEQLGVDPQPEDEAPDDLLDLMDQAQG